MGRSQLPGEMSEGLNANRLKNVSIRFRTIKVFPPAVTDPSVLDAQDHYLRASWSSEGNLREASHLADSKGQEQRGIFLYLIPECKQ